METEFDYEKHYHWLVCAFGVVVFVDVGVAWMIIVMHDGQC